MLIWLLAVGGDGTVLQNQGIITRKKPFWDLHGAVGFNEMSENF